MADLPSALAGPRTHNLQLAGAVAAGARITIVSRRITFAFLVRRLSIHFHPGADLLVHAYLILSSDPSAPIAALPGGLSLLSFLSPLDYFSGDDTDITVYPNFPVAERGAYLKLHLHNTDAFPHEITAQIEIAELPSEES